MPTATCHDSVVIGSGVAGLATACLLAETGRRVVVLEQHAFPGGLLQRFRRRGVSLDTGVHYLGGLGPGGPLRAYLSALGVLDGLVLEPFDPQGFDEVVLPGRRFRYPIGRDAISAALRTAFPHESLGVGEFLRRLWSAADSYHWFSFLPESLPAAPSVPGSGPLLADGIDRLVADPELKAVLASHTLLHGVPAVEVPLDCHALICASYHDSCHGIAGGGGALVGALCARLRDLGGEISLRAEAARIETSQGRARRVVTTDGDVREADEIVAAIHPQVVVPMIDARECAQRHLRRVSALRNTPSALLVHAVARGAPPPPLRRNWLWFRRNEDAWRERPAWFDAEGVPPGLVILSGPVTGGSPGSTVFHVMCPMSSEEIRPSTRREWKQRKMAAAQALVPILERCVPAWRSRIEILDVSTPYAFRHFLRSPEGSCYGVACADDQWLARQAPHRLGPRNLWFAGQSVGLPGVLGAVTSAFLAAGSILRNAPALYRRVRAAQRDDRRRTFEPMEAII